MKNGFKSACVFIGTVIGAGFATGREVVLYFNGYSPLIALLSGFVLGLLCAFFMVVGKSIKGGNLNQFISPKFKKILDFLVFLNAYITFVAMFAGAESLIFQIFGVKFIGIISAVIAVYIAVSGLRQIKILNVIVVPLIIMLVTVIFFKNEKCFIVGKIGILNSVAYSTMNIMLAGYIMARLGSNAKKNEIISAGIISSIVLGIMLFMILCVVSGDNISSMPLYSASYRLGIGRLSGVLIYFAIFTTLVSSADLLINCIDNVLKSKWLSSISAIAISWPICMLFSFDNIVDYTYPLVSVFGVVLTIVVIIKYTQLKIDSHQVIEIKQKNNSLI